MSAADGDPVAVTRATYDRVAAGYDARNATVPADLAAERDAWVATVRPGARLLDAGAGPGQHTAAFAAAGLRAVALDLSASMAALAAGRGVPVVLGDLRRPPFAAGTFDALWSAAALLHVPRPDVPATLAAWRRVTAPGGRLLLSTAFGAADGWEEAPYARDGEAPVPRWFVFHEPDALAALVRAAGWRVESVTTRRALRHWVTVRAVAA
ncbi:MAG TPA: methyltransferase domain-containing protein [Mycobacteriales bacterium]|nr:methyltransferase domain-containing protein [Mycobacteriales bacterium]